MDGHMNGQKTGSLYRTMPEAAATKLAEFANSPESDEAGSLWIPYML